jgi:hypothetical protein
MEINIEQILSLLAKAPAFIEKYGRQICGDKKWDKVSSEDFDLKKCFQMISDAQKMKVHLEMVKNSSWEQFRNLASVSAVCSTLLIIATFNNRILPYDNNIKLLLTILLLTIAISVYAFYKNFNSAQEKSWNELLLLTEKYGNEDEIKQMKDLKTGNDGRFLAHVPFIANYAIIFVICSIIILIWIN